jgi:hypothetical protein
MLSTAHRIANPAEREVLERLAKQTFNENSLRHNIIQNTTNPSLERTASISI